jgi:nucleoside-diphosphate-sugar epimerase
MAEFRGGELKHVAITGATGFLGSNLTDRLLAAGKTVAGLARTAEKAAALEGKGARVVIGDIADPDTLHELFTGMDAVVHLVSNFRTTAGPPEEYRRINVEGTKVALEVARKVGVKRFVHCSTIGVHGHVRSTPADESSPYNPGDLYQSTKLEAEQAVLAAVPESDIEIVVVRPCSIYGPGDLRMLKMFKMLQKQRFFLVGACQENFHAVYIDDLTEGFRLALDTPGISGEVFLIGGAGFLPLQDYLATASAAVGSPPPKLRFPYWLFFGGAMLCEALCAPFGIEPPLHRRRVRFFRNNRAFSIGKARERLGYAPQVSLEEGMARTVAWYRETGYL